MKNFLKNFRKTIEVNYTDFATAIGYNYRNKKKPYYLMQHIIVIVRVATQTYYIKLDKGFTSDGCTVPYIFRWIIGCQHTPEYIPASLIHDWILQHPQTVHRNRKLSSLILKTALLNEGVTPLKAHVMYLAVEFAQWWNNFKTKRWR